MASRDANKQKTLRFSGASNLVKREHVLVHQTRKRIKTQLSGSAGPTF